MNKYKKILTVIAAFILASCATYTPKYKVENFTTTLPSTTIKSRFFLIGDAGYAMQNKSTKGLQALSKVLDTAAQSKDDYLLFLGDNIYQKGMPQKNAPDRTLSEHRINAQIDAVKNFKGNVVFIPGNHDWYNDGLSGLKRQEKYIKKKIPNGIW